jgi:hypothetical protein
MKLRYERSSVNHRYSHVCEMDNGMAFEPASPNSSEMMRVDPILNEVAHPLPSRLPTGIVVHADLRKLDGFAHAVAGRAQPVAGCDENNPELVRVAADNRSKQLNGSES